MAKFITIEELAQRLNRSGREIRRLAALGRIPGAQRINARLWLIEDSARLVDVLKKPKKDKCSDVGTVPAAKRDGT